MGMDGSLADHGCQHGVPVVLGALPMLPLEVAPIMPGVEPMPLGLLPMLPELRRRSRLRADVVPEDSYDS
jgi:hypothetical protein